MKKTLVFILFLLSLLTCLAQERGQDNALMHYMRTAMRVCKYYPQEKVYLHLDNTGYFKGETIWFKAYVTRCDTEARTDLSHILYVELLNPSGDVVERRKLPIENGMAHGDIRTDSIMTAGFYEIRAYTRYMTNWGTNACFSRVIPVFKTPKVEGDYANQKIDLYSYRKRLPDMRLDESGEEKLEENPFKAIGNAPKVYLYPESGNLVQGIKSRVAYSINYGDSTDRGIMEVIPDGTNGAFAFTDRRGKKRNVPLPEAQKEGIVLTLGMTDDTFVTATVCASEGMKGKALGCVVMHSGTIALADTFRVTEDSCVRKYVRAKLPEGVSQITIFNEQGLPMAERQFFICPRRDATHDIMVKMNTESILPCKKVEMELTALPNSSISFSAMDCATMTGGKEGNALTWMLLASDLRGYIDHPEYYFEADDKEHREKADLLTMIQGWRRYKWEQLAGIEPLGKMEPVEDQLFFNGSVVAKHKKEGNDGVAMTAYLYNREGVSLKGTCITDEYGMYRFNLPDIAGEWNLQVVTEKDGKAKDYIVGIDRNFAPDGRWISAEETAKKEIAATRIFSSTKSIEEEESLPITQRNHVLKNVTVKSKRLIGDVNMTAWNDDYSARLVSTLYYDADKDCDMYADKGENPPAFGDWIKSKNKLFGGDSQPLHKLVRMRDGKIKDHEVFMYEDSCYKDEAGFAIASGLDEMPPRPYHVLWRDGISYRNKAIVWIVDNRFSTVTNYTRKEFDVADESKLGNQIQIPTRLDEVKSVYITDDTSILNSFISSNNLLGLSPTVVFVYRHASQAWHQKGIRSTSFQGFSTPETFKMEDYTNLPPVEDFRRTLYWNPNVTTDKDGKARIEFFNNSSCTEMFISAEGISEDGKVIVY